MSDQLTRRDFLRIGGVAALSASPLMQVAARQPKTAARGSQAAQAAVRVVYRLSLRGRRGSQAAKKHNANHLFTTAEAANTHRAHPGDRSRVVTVTISDQVFNDLFTRRGQSVVDLRLLGKNAAATAWALYQ